MTVIIDLPHLTAQDGRQGVRVGVVGTFGSRCTMWSAFLTTFRMKTGRDLLPEEYIAEFQYKDREDQANWCDLKVTVKAKPLAPPPPPPMPKRRERDPWGW